MFVQVRWRCGRQPRLERSCIRHALVALFQRCLVVAGEDTDKLWQAVWPLLQNCVGDGTSSVSVVRLQQVLEIVNIVRVCSDFLVDLHASKLNSFTIHLRFECSVGIPDPSHTPAHACSKVVSCLTEHSNTATSHVLTAMIACAFNNYPRTTVPHGEALGTHTAHESNARRRTVQCRVSDDHVFVRLESCLHCCPGRVDRKDAPTETFPEIVLRVAFELEEDTLSDKCTKRLTRRPVELCMTSASRQRVPPGLVDLVR